MADAQGVLPIRTKLLERNYLFAIEFAEGWIFGRVVRRRPLHFRPYKLIDSAGNAVTLAKTTTKTALYFRDPRNAANDLLNLKTTTDSGWPWILHGGIGILQHQIYMYPHLPDSGPIVGQFPNADITSAQVGDKTGFVSANESPFEEPTDWLEYVITPTIKFSAEWYNQDTNRAHQPDLNLLFACYWFELLQPGPMDSKMGWQSKLIGKIARREGSAANASYLPAGFGQSVSSLPYPLGTTVIQDWHAKPISLSDAEAL